MPEVVIIGGGPAGSTAAIKLARAGRKVTLIERNRGPSHKVCGDFLSGEAATAIADLGIGLEALGAEPITNVRLVHGCRVATAPLPFMACGISRHTLDEALLRQAAADGATVLRGHSISRVQPTADSLNLSSPTLGVIETRSVFLATGKHDVRGAQRPAHADSPIGLKSYFSLDPAQRAELRGHVELVLFDGGYAGLQLVETGQAVLCLLVSRRRLRASGGRWETLLAHLMTESPHLAKRMANSRALLSRSLAVTGLPYGYLHAATRTDPPGLFRLGDQVAVIPSLTGDGIALAIASASSAAAIWLKRGKAAPHYHREFAHALSRQMRLASAVQYLSLKSAIQPWLVHACRVAPAGMRYGAAWTRFNESALTV